MRVAGRSDTLTSDARARVLATSSQRLQSDKAGRDGSPVAYNHCTVKNRALTAEASCSSDLSELIINVVGVRLRLGGAKWPTSERGTSLCNPSILQPRKSLSFQMGKVIALKHCHAFSSGERSLVCFLVESVRRTYLAVIRTMLDRRSVNVSAPYIFPPSGSFSGSDGAWSTFYVNIGDSGEVDYGQDFEVLVSTAASTVIVPLAADWCTVPDAETCARSRGVAVWNGQQSLGFQHETPAENYQSVGLYTLSLQANLDHGPDEEARAQYGSTTVGLGVLSDDSPHLLSQLVAAIVTRNFPMGYFGLSTTPVKLTNAQYETFLTNFKDEIPSQSYGYTAGARYRE